MYKSRDKNTPPLFPELFPLGGSLNFKNRWLRLAQIMPWEALEEIYARQFTDTGRPAKDARLVCGLLTVCELAACGDEEAIILFNENPYIQAFCGLEHFVTTDSVLAAGLLAKTRRNAGGELFRLLTEQVLDNPEHESLLRSGFGYRPSADRSLAEKILAAAKALLARLRGQKR